MKIQVGDQVRFLDDVGGGKVTALTGKDMAMVETTDGFEIPAYIRNLVVVASAQPASPKAASVAGNATKTAAPSYQEKGRNAPFAESDQVKGNDFPSYIFALVPRNPGNPPAEPMELFLVNDCNYTLLYHFALKTGDNYRTLDAGTLEPNTKISLETLHPRNFSEQPEYCFQLLSFRRDAKQLEEPVQKEISISPVKLFKPGSFVKNRYFKEPAMIIKLADHPLKAELDKLTEKDFNKITAAKEPRPAASITLPDSDLLEVDLHIEQLLDDLRGLENSDMLKVQLDHFRKEMENAITKGIKRIVFIHGVGDGVLKNELRRELQRKYAKYPFQDASFREYGFGATMVILKK